ncbi:MAG: class II glutamine amidotransferase [Candidatus Bipolaricaulota bacterium]
MCRMVAAPEGIPGYALLDAFVRMARGENVETEKNAPLGCLRHGDGWGAVLLDSGRARSGRACWDDPGFRSLRNERVQLLHARLASRGAVDASNAHPFTASLRGETWYFSHNGTFLDEPEDGTAATDSERFFRRMAVGLERGEDPVTAFEFAVARLERITAANSLLLGPTGLWAFCVWADPKSAKYYTLSRAETPYGPVVSSEPLADLATDWVPIENGTALVFTARADGGTSTRTTRLRLPASLKPAGV